MLLGSRMELVSQIGGGVTNGLAYIGSLTSLAGRAAYFTFVAPFRGKPLRLQRAVSQALEVGVRALPILSLITFFIGLILALQARLRAAKVWGYGFGGYRGGRFDDAGTWAVDYGDCGDWAIGFGVCGGNRDHEGDRGD